MKSHERTASQMRPTAATAKIAQLALNKDTSNLTALVFALLLLKPGRARHAVYLVETLSQHSRSRRARSPRRAAAKEPS